MTRLCTEGTCSYSEPYTFRAVEFAVTTCNRTVTYLYHAIFGSYILILSILRLNSKIILRIDNSRQGRFGGVSVLLYQRHYMYD